jgi:hypothetical protein
MKRAYSEFRFSKKVMQAYESMIGQPERYVFAKIKEGVRVLLPEADESEIAFHANLSLHSAMAQFQAQSGDCLHFFFKGDGIADWLASCSTELADETIAMIGEIAPQFHKESINRRAFCFMLHFPGGNSPCYLCKVQGKTIITDNGGISKVADANWVIQVIRSSDQMSFFSRADVVGMGMDVRFNDKETEETLGFIAACVAYIRCFPETVVDGIPDDLKHPNHHKYGRSKTVGIADGLIVRDGPSPHFRSGHFRHLTSDRYTTKRGMTVFVRGAFVKGKAKTVLSPEEVAA